MHPFINKLLCFLLAIALVVALAVPVFAADFNGHELPELPDDGYPIKIIKYWASSELYELYTCESVLSSTNTDFTVSGRMLYHIEGGKWKTAQPSRNTQSMSFDNGVLLWSNTTLTRANGEVVITGTPEPGAICDGSSCPATDADHNNICDDCGKVLTYNLRSTLLDFAKTTAESFSDGYPYYAVLEHPTKDGSYNLFISKSPMRADVPNYDVAIGDSMQYTEVFTNSDGSFDRATWASVSSFSGTLVYSNHTIENFQTPPLAVIIQGVTGEALETEIPNLMTETRTIVLCGVGCLALLIALVLLSKKLKIFLKR